MPALGIAITLQYIFKGEARIFLFLGFMIATVSGMTLIEQGIVGLIMAIIYIQLAGGKTAVAATAGAPADGAYDPDYDLDSIKDTLNNLSGKVGALEGVWNSVKSFFVGSGDGILNDTDDSALGSNIITDSNVDVSGFKDGLLTRIINFFKGE